MTSSNRPLKLARAVFFAVFVAACTSPDAYVYRENDFDRNDPSFGRPLTDLAEATVCYGASGTTPQTVNALAAAECATVGKRAVFDRQTYTLCPVTTPVAAVFKCVAR